MMGVKNNFLFCILIVFILSFALSYASTEDFQFLAYSNTAVCSCTSFFVEGELINIGDVASSYIITDLGTASSWSNIAPEYVTLLPNERKKITTFVNVPCNAEGKYTLYTRINSALGLEKIHSMVIDVKNCNVLSIKPIISKKEVCKGDVATYQFEVINNGKTDEIIQPSFNSKKINAEFNLKSYYVEKSSKETIYLYLHSFDLLGENNFQVNFYASRSGQRYNVPITYKAYDCYPTSQKLSKESQKVIFSGNLDLLPFIYSIILLLILFLTLLFFALLLKALKKRKKNKNLEKWIDASKDDEKILAESKKAEKKPKQKTKKLQEYTKDNQERILKLKKLAKILGLILLLLLVLFLIAALVWLFAPFLKGLADSVTNQIGQIVDSFNRQKLENITEPKITPEKQPEIKQENISAKNETFAKLKWNNVNLMNPIISFFSSYTNLCTVLISIFIIMFVLSLIFFGVKPKENWSEKKKNIFNYFRYSLPIIFFACLVFCTVFCVYNNTKSDEMFCATLYYENVSCDTDFNNVTSNVTSLKTEAKIEKQSVPKCFCTTFFGKNIRLRYCLLILLALLLLLLFIPLIPVLKLWRLFKPKKKKKSKENSETEEEIEEDELLLNKNIKSEKKKKKKSLGIWKDLLILLLLLLLLIGIGVLLYYYFPFTDISKIMNASELFADNEKNVSEDLLLNESLYNETNNNETETTQTPIIPEIVPVPVITPIKTPTPTPTQISEQKPSQTLKEIEVLPKYDLLCNVKLPKIPEKGVLVLFGDNRQTISIDGQIPYSVSYSWYLNRKLSGYIFAYNGYDNNVLPATQIKVGDYWICQATFRQLNKSMSLNATPFKITENITEEDISSRNIDYVLSEVVRNGNKISSEKTVTSANDTKIKDENLTKEDIQKEEVKELSDLERVNQMIKYIEENNLSDSFGYLIIEEGTSKEIDLKKYFFDPDNDTLIFRVINKTSDKISVDIWKGTATFTTEKNFIGIENVTIRAEDPKGEFVEGIITVISKPKESKFITSVKNFLSNYWKHIVVGVIIFILLLAFIILYNLFDNKNKAKKEKKQNSDKKQKKHDSDKQEDDEEFEKPF